MNALYDNVRERAAKALFNWLTTPASLIACNGPYVFDETHAHLTDLGSAGAVQVMASLTVTGQVVKPGGYCSSDAALLPTIPVGPPVTFFVLVDMTSGAQVPLAYIDEAINLPFEPNGLDWLVQPDWLPLRGWFRL